MKFSNLVSESLTKDGKMSLTLLVEEEEKKEEKKSDDPFAVLDDIDGDSDDDSETLGDDASDPLDDDVSASSLDDEGLDVENNADPNEDKNKAIDALNALSRYDNEIDKVDAKRSEIIKKYSVAEASYYKTLKLDSFLMIEKKEDDSENEDAVIRTIEDYEEKIEDLEGRLYRVKSDSPKSGVVINIVDKVEKAVSEIENFYKKRKPSDIVYNEFVKTIGDEADIANLETTIKNFRDELNKKLNPEDRIGIQEKPSGYNAAVGASSVGKS
jgi:hypothetical protein